MLYNSPSVKKEKMVPTWLISKTGAQIIADRAFGPLILMHLAGVPHAASAILGICVASRSCKDLDAG